MTIRGIFCVVLEALLLVLGLGTGYRALLVAALCLGLVLAVAVLSMLVVLLGTRAGGEIDRTELQRGGEITYTVVIKGLILLPVAGYLSLLPPGVERREKGALTRHSFLLMPSFKWRRTVTIRQTCPHQGYWQAGPESMRYEDLFGLFRLHLLGLAKRRLRRTLAVLPHIHPLTVSANATVSANGFASTQLRSAPSGELLGDARLFQPGDPLKRIHWKLTARTREVHVRQFELQENSQILLMLDLQCRSPQRRATADLSVETLLSLLTYYTDRNMPVRLLPVRGDRDATLTQRRVSNAVEVKDVQERLLSHRYKTVSVPLDAWQLQDAEFSTVGTVIVITDNPSEQLISDLDTLAASGRQVACISPCVGVEPLPLSGAQAQPVLLYKPEDIAEKVGACV